MNRKLKRAPFFILFGVAAAFIVGSVVMVLWNAIIPAVFHLGTVTLLQAVGILVLARLLFGGFRGKARHCRNNRPGMMEKWENKHAEDTASINETVRQYTANWQMRYSPDSAL